VDGETLKARDHRTTVPGRAVRPQRGLRSPAYIDHSPETGV